MILRILAVGFVIASFLGVFLLFVLWDMMRDWWKDDTISDRS